MYKCSCGHKQRRHMPLRAVYTQLLASLPLGINSVVVCACVCVCVCVWQVTCLPFVLSYAESGMKQQPSASGGKFKETLSVADTTTSVGTSTASSQLREGSLTGGITQTQRHSQTPLVPARARPAPPFQSKSQPPPTRFSTRPPRTLCPPGLPPYPPPISQQPLFSGWPRCFPPRPLFPPRNGSPTSIHPNLPPSRVSTPTTQSQGASSSTTGISSAQTPVVKPGPVSAAQVALPSVQSCSKQTKTSVSATPAPTQRIAPKVPVASKHQATSVGVKLPLPSPSQATLPRPQSSKQPLTTTQASRPSTEPSKPRPIAPLLSKTSTAQQSSRPPPLPPQPVALKSQPPSPPLQEPSAILKQLLQHTKPTPPLPTPLGYIGEVALYIPSSGGFPPKASSGLNNKEKASGVQESSALLASTKEQTETRYGVKLPPLRIPKLSHAAKRLQKARVSPSITWDSPLILPKPVPPCSVGGTNASSSSVNTAAQNKAVGSSPKKKKKKKKAASQQSDSIAIGLTGKKPQGTKKKKKKKQKGVLGKEAQGKNQRIVIRDTLPKFIPPEKTKKPSRCQPGGSMVSVEQMEVSQPQPCSSTVTEQHPTPLGRKIAQRPSVLGSRDPVSSIRACLTEFARTLPTHPPNSSRPVQQPRELRKSSSTEPPVEETDPKGRPCMSESTRWSPISHRPAQQPKPPQVCEKRKLSSSEPHVKETQPKGRPFPTAPPPGSFKQPTEVRKSSSSEPPVRDTQSQSRPSATEPAISLSKSLNPTHPPPHKASLGSCSAAGGVSATSGSKDSEEQVSGFVLRLPPSRVKGGSLLFGDVIAIEGRAENQSVEMATEHHKELGKKVGVGMQPSGNRNTSHNVSTVPSSHRTGAGNGSTAPSSQTNGSAIATVNSSRATQRDAATTQQKSGVRANSQPKCWVQATTQPAPAEGSGKTLPISRISSDGCRGPHSGNQQPRPRSSSLPAEDSVVSGGQKRPRSTSSSTEAAPPTPKQSRASVKCEPLTPTLTNPEPSLDSVESEPVFALMSDVFQKLQEKIDFEVSKMRLMDLGQIPRNPQSGGQIPRNPLSGIFTDNSTPAAGKQVEAETDTLPLPTQEGLEEPPPGPSTSATTCENQPQQNGGNNETRARNEPVEARATSAPPNSGIGPSNCDAFQNNALFAGERESSPLPKGPLPSDKTPSDSNVLPKGPLPKRPSDGLPKGPNSKKRPSDSNALQISPEEIPPESDSLPKGQLSSEKRQSDSTAVSEDPHSRKRDPPVVCATFKTSREPPILSTPPRCLKLNRPTLRISSSTKAVDRKGVGGAPAANTATVPQVDITPLQPAIHGATEPASHKANEPASHRATEAVRHKANEPVSHMVTDRGAKSRSMSPKSRCSSPRLDVIINSLKSKRIVASDAGLSDRKFEENDRFSSGSPFRGGGSSQRKKRRKSAHDDRGGAKKLRLETSESITRGCVEHSTSVQPSPCLEPAMVSYCLLSYIISGLSCC